MLRARSEPLATNGRRWNEAMIERILSQIRKELFASITTHLLTSHSSRTAVLTCSAWLLCYFVIMSLLSCYKLSAKDQRSTSQIRVSRGVITLDDGNGARDFAHFPLRGIAEITDHFK